ncbi:MAG: metallophosphoesterase [Candidatus Schekmanbacteria bacterium]|nr:MAG: metallophosphoesterase [Candidatus Schekmanbacteria bacterium]
MKIAIISDIHSNLEAFESVLKKIEKIDADSIYCLGDIVGYNANPNECVEIIREREIPSLMGNHDRVACGIEEPIFFNPVAREAVLWTRGELSQKNRDFLCQLPEKMNISNEILCVHGSPRDADEYIFGEATAEKCLNYLEDYEIGIKICFFVHTHFKAAYSTANISPSEGSKIKFHLKENYIYLINPGSVGQPRDRDWRASFVVFDSEKKLITYYLEEYDVEKTAEKIRKKELPLYLAERLFEGK